MNSMKLSEPQMKMLQEAADSPNLRASAAHRKGRTARKLAGLGLGTLSFYGALGFQINKAGLALLDRRIVDGLWVVGDNETTKWLGIFLSHDEAAEYISTLPGHERGDYYLDGPCKDVIHIRD